MKKLQKFKVGDMVKIPNTKHGKKPDGAVYHNAIKKEAKFLFVTQIRSQAPGYTLDDEKGTHSGDYYDEGDLELYIESYEIY